jgi:hypothetical protein
MNSAEQLISKYPLRVHFPTLSGSYFMLVWYTDDLRRNMIIGRSEEGVLKTYEGVLQQHETAQPVEYLRFEPVQPSFNIKLAWAKQEYRKEKSSFFFWLTNQFDQFDHLPQGVKKCDNYSNSEPNEFDLLYHASCTNCLSSYVFENEENIFEDYLYLMYEHHGVIRNRVKDLPYFSGEADPKKKLYYVETNLGHHSNGSSIKKVDKNYISDSVAFFCHLQKLKIPRKAKFFFEEKQLLLEKDMELRQEEIKLAHEKSDKEVRGRLRTIFKDCSFKNK